MSTNNIPLKPHVEHEVEHCRQRFNWDCGVSCVLMLLPKDQRDYFLDNFTAICEEEGFRQSTWTIDLCYLLKRFGIKHRMYTTMLGVNEAYSRYGYYDKIIHLALFRRQLLGPLHRGGGVPRGARAVPRPRAGAAPVRRRARRPRARRPPARHRRRHPTHIHATDRQLTHGTHHQPQYTN